MTDSLDQRALINNLRLFALAVIGALIVGAVAMVVRGQAGAVAMLGTATPTSTATPTPTWTATATPTPTATATATPSLTSTATASPTPTLTPRPADTRAPARPTQRAVTPPPTPTPGTPTPTPTPVPRTVLVASLNLPDASTAQDHFRFARPFDDQYATWGSSYYPFGTNARGQYLWHQGMDIQNRYGTPILAVGDGVVVRAGPDERELYGPRLNFFGQAVLVQHHEPWNGLPVFTLYGHVSRILVRVGESVTTGQVIAEVGQGGVALGPHLHLEVRVGSADYRDARNPYLWVTPDPGYGVIAGRVVDARGYVVPQQLVLLYRAEEPNRYWRETFTYPDNIVKPDPAWGELFAFGDIPVGAYVVKTRLDGKVYTQAITVTDRATTFVLFDAREHPAAPTPAAQEDPPSSE